MITKFNLKNKMIPVLKRIYIDNDVKELYEIFPIEKYLGIPLYKLFSIDDELVLYDDIDEYYRNNKKDYDWEQINEWSEKNIEKLRYVYVPHIDYDDIILLRHKYASSILFSSNLLKRITGKDTLYICPLMENLVIMTKKGEYEDFKRLVKVIKDLSMTLKSRNKLLKFITEDIFSYNVETKKFVKVSSRAEFGMFYNYVPYGEHESTEDIYTKVKRETEKSVMADLYETGDIEKVDQEAIDIILNYLEGETMRGILNAKNNK